MPDSCGACGRPAPTSSWRPDFAPLLPGGAARKAGGTIATMARRVVIAGAGIGGLAAAVACARAGWSVALLERTAAFEPVGAGIQIGPNVTRVLQRWGMEQALATVAAVPTHLQVRDVLSGRELGRLTLGATAQQRYGAPYVTLHRADLQRLLLDALGHHPAVELHTGSAVTSFTQTEGGVCTQSATRGSLQSEVLVGADGLWSAVRQSLLGDGAPRPTGHVAYRALVPQADLPQKLRSQHITVWLGPRLHVVHYPVRAGEWLNVVGIVDAGADADAGAGRTTPVGPSSVRAGAAHIWGEPSGARALHNVLSGAAPALQDLVHSIGAWQRWALYDRAPVARPGQLADGRVALLGDAAHPMRPYLAQGAGMAIEDAAQLEYLLEPAGRDVAAALRRYAEERWRRNTRVQARALRNGRIFHARGPLRWGRDLAMRLLGERVLDLPWLYRG